MTAIIGVDFSGAKHDRNTWAARGRLAPDGELWFDSVQPVLRQDLFKLLATVPTPAVAALDFPFGVPAAFAAYLNPRCKPGEAAMPAVWQTIAGMSAEQFALERNNFVSQFGEHKRTGDAAYGESFSPLHRFNPDMLPMTYYGIGMLHRCHEDYPARWHAPPLDPPSNPEGTVTLLETMPGAFLKAIGLKHTGYKNRRDALDALQRRAAILDGLDAKSDVLLPNLSAVEMGCRASHDCLDSVIAAVAAAAWAQDPDRFRRPNADKLPQACLEGWIYCVNIESHIGM